MYGSDCMHTIIIASMYMLLFYSIYKVMFFFKRRKVKDELYGLMEIYYLEHLFKVKVKSIDIDKLLNIVALSNAAIFTIVLMTTEFIDNIIIRLLIMFVLLMPAIYIFYYGISIYLKKKGNKK